VGILAALAKCGYGWAMIKTRRAAAEGCLVESAQHMERWYTTHMTYVGGAPPACSADVGTYYTVGFAAGEPTATTFKFDAVPKGPQAKDGCATLSVDDRGRKLPVANCW
jgi:type IV pilus assembly protein PilE